MTRNEVPFPHVPTESLWMFQSAQTIPLGGKGNPWKKGWLQKQWSRYGESLLVQSLDSESNGRTLYPYFYQEGDVEVHGVPKRRVFEEGPRVQLKDKVPPNSEKFSRVESFWWEGEDLVNLRWRDSPVRPEQYQAQNTYLFDSDSSRRKSHSSEVIRGP